MTEIMFLHTSTPPPLPQIIYFFFSLELGAQKLKFKKKKKNHNTLNKELPSTGTPKLPIFPCKRKDLLRSKRHVQQPF